MTCIKMCERNNNQHTTNPIGDCPNFLGCPNQSGGCTSTFSISTFSNQSGSCNQICQNSCQNCEGRCESACQKNCQNCQGNTCLNSCQNCEGRCETACQKNCQNCQGTSCQTCQNCEGRCETACQKKCQNCQGNVCLNTCQNCEGRCETASEKNKAPTFSIEYIDRVDDRKRRTPTNIACHFSDDNGLKETVVKFVGYKDRYGNDVKIVKQHSNFPRRYTENVLITSAHFNTNKGETSYVELSATDIYDRTSKTNVRLKIKRSRFIEAEIEGPKDLGNKYSDFNIIFNISDESLIPPKKEYIKVGLNRNYVDADIVKVGTVTTDENNISHAKYKIVINQNILSKAPLNQKSEIEIAYNNEDYKGISRYVTFTRIVKPCVNCEGRPCQNCETVCEKLCQTTCQKGCQNTCEKSCQNCEGRCETTCEKACQNCQGVTCQNNQTQSIPHYEQNTSLGDISTPDSFNQIFMINASSDDNALVEVYLNGNKTSNSNRTYYENTMFDGGLTDEEFKNLPYNVNGTLIVNITRKKYTSRATVNFRKVNSAPRFTDTNRDLGNLDTGFELDLSAINFEDIDVNVYIDEKLINGTHTVKPKNHNNYHKIHINVDKHLFMKLGRGDHTLKIEAIDRLDHAKGIRQYTFRKQVPGLYYIHKEKSTNKHAKKIIIRPNWFVSNGAIGKIYVCNNANDENPTWEDMTVDAIANTEYTFINTNKTSEKYAVAVKITIERNSASQDSYLSSFSGSYIL